MMKQLGVAAFVFGFVVACTGGSSDNGTADGGSSSSSSSSSTSSSSSGGLATPQTIFEGRFEQAADGGATCNDVGPLTQIGSFGESGLSSPVKDNERTSDGLVRTSCIVKRSAASPDAFDVQGSIAHSTMGFTISGVFRPSGEQPNLKVRFTTRGKELAQIDNQCFARYTKGFHGVAAGRVWAEVECPSVTEAGGGNGSICRAIAEMRFENCAQ
jgi:hypothetical protein